MSPKQKTHTVSAQAFILLMSVAALFDSVQAAANYAHVIPVVGNAAAVIFTILVNGWAYPSIWLGFKLAAPDVKFMTPKRALALNGGLLIELIPVLNALPAWTLAVVLIFLTTRGEEAIAETLEKTGKVMGAAGKMAGAAAKIPGMNKNLKQGLEQTAARAQGAAETAQTKAAQARQGMAAGLQDVRSPVAAPPPLRENAPSGTSSKNAGAPAEKQEERSFAA